MTTTISKDTKEQLAVIDSLRDFITKQVRRTKLAEKFIGNWDESIL